MLFMLVCCRIESSCRCTSDAVSSVSSGSRPIPLGNGTRQLGSGPCGSFHGPGRWGRFQIPRPWGREPAARDEAESCSFASFSSWWPRVSTCSATLVPCRHTCSSSMRKACASAPTQVAREAWSRSAAKSSSRHCVTMPRAPPGSALMRRPSASSWSRCVCTAQASPSRWTHVATSSRKKRMSRTQPRPSMAAPSPMVSGSGISPICPAHGNSRTVRSPSWRVPLPKGIGLDPLETLDTASDVQRQLDSIRHQDSMKSMLGPGGKRLLKFLPVLGAVPDGVEAGQALVDGDTGAVIGNLYEAGVAAVPHPLTATISLANDIGDLALPGDSSPLEHLGEIAAHGDRARMGEMVGGTISDYLGYEDGSLVDNMLTAGLGTVGHLSPLTPPGAAVESASAVRNWAAETW